MSRTERTAEERVRWLLAHARRAENRGESDLARSLRAMARDLRPARAGEVAR